MKILPNIARLILFCGLLILFYGDLHAQMNKKLKNFLWEKDITEMLSLYGEESITLRDSGDFKIRIGKRSFREVQGFRVQVFAGTSRENAQKMFQDLVHLQMDSVYLVQQNGLNKVQLGNYLYRIDAEKALDKLRFEGMTNAWIVETAIHVPKEMPAESPPVTEEVPAGITEQYLYAIQVFVSRDRQRAEEFSGRLQQDLPGESWVLQSGEYWKVLIGKYEDEGKARQRLSEIRDSGFSDAWLTQVNE